MSTQQQTQQQTAQASNSHELETLIDKAIKKVSGNKENDICRYLPAKNGGYLHHFTLRKMKTEERTQLSDMIQRYILSVDTPVTVQPKPRAARGSRKRRDQIAFSKHDLERMLAHARAAGDQDMVRKLTPVKDLKTIKRELIASIRHNKIEEGLWLSYVDAVTTDATSSQQAGGSTAQTMSGQTAAQTYGATTAGQQRPIG